MRKPLTRQNSTRDKRRYSAYQNRIFFYLVTLVTAPLLLLGVLSSVVYYRQTVTRSDALLASVRENVETQMEIALSNPARLLQRGRQHGQLPDPVPKNCAAVQRVHPCARYADRHARRQSGG